LEQPASGGIDVLSSSSSLLAAWLTLAPMGATPPPDPATQEPSSEGAAVLPGDTNPSDTSREASPPGPGSDEAPTPPPQPAPTPAPPPATPPPVEAPAGPPGWGDTALDAPPAATGTAGLQRILNPDISAIGNFVAVAGKSPGSGEPAIELRELEIGLQSIVDPYARADVFLTVGPDEVGIEEGYITFLALPGSLLAKVGRMRDAFGKVNAMHSHILPTVDRPLVSQNLLGGEEALADSGISVARLIPIPAVFLEATAQVFRGESEVFKAPTRADLAYVGHLRLYRDVTESSNVDLGGSVAYGHNGDDDRTTTRLIGADVTFRYKPLRRAIYRHFLARAELVWSRREAAEAPVASAFGAYAYLEYKLARRWVLAARYDYSDRADAPSLHDEGGSLLLTYRPSEFSLVRGQYRQTRLGEGQTHHELLFQVQFAIGAHGAHPF
jgi:hypothetical protein